MLYKVYDTNIERFVSMTFHLAAIICTYFMIFHLTKYRGKIKSEMKSYHGHL